MAGRRISDLTPITGAALASDDLFLVRDTSAGETKSITRAELTLGVVPNGDKGDITTSAGGATWTIDNDVVTYAKMQNASAQYVLLGRSSSGAGDFQEVATSADTFTLLGGANFAAWRTNLGLVIGTNVQAWDADLDTLAGLAKTDGNFIVGDGATWVVESGATVRTSLGLTIGTDVQAYDATLAALAGLNSTAGMVTQTGADAFTKRSLAGAGLAVASNADGSAGNPTVTVTAASDAEARAQTSTTAALTPANLAGRASFRVTLSGAQTGIANITFTKLAFNTEAFDIGSCYDTTLYRWVPPAGKIRISASAYVSAGQTLGQVVQLSIAKNGTAFADDFHWAGSTGGLVNAHAIDTANGTDYYEAYIYVTTASTGTVDASTRYTFFCGEQV